MKKTLFAGFFARAALVSVAVAGLWLGEVRSAPGADSAPDSGQSPNTAPPQRGKAGPPGRGGQQGRSGPQGKVEAPFKYRENPGKKLSPEMARRQASARANPLSGQGGDRDLLLASHAFMKGRSRAAATRLLAAVEKHPDMIRLHTMLAISDARDGWYSDAVSQFGFGRFDVYYEREGIDDHALSLRMVGRGSEAAALRLSQRVLLDDDENDLTLLVEAADDLMAAGDFGAAESLLEEAVGRFPRSSASHAAYASLFFQTDRPDEGDIELFLAYDNGAPSFKARMVEAERKIATGDYMGAEKELNRAGSARPRSLDVAALAGQNLLAMGSPAEVISMLENDAFDGQQHPGVLAVQIEALTALGRTSEARALLAEARALSPGYPDINRAAAGLAR